MQLVSMVERRNKNLTGLERRSVCDDSVPVESLLGEGASAYRWVSRLGSFHRAGGGYSRPHGRVVPKSLVGEAGT